MARDMNVVDEAISAIDAAIKIGEKAEDAIASCDIEPFTITKLGFNEPPPKDVATFREMEKKYKALVSEMTVDEELELVGISLKKAFPPIDRDVEKLVIDMNLIIYKYMQSKMEQNTELRVETIRSTVQTSLAKITAALFTMAADEK